MDKIDSLNRRNSLRLLFHGPIVLRRAAEKEALVLATICMADMFTTLMWVTMGYATEANHLLAWTFDVHPITFVLVKSVSCIPAVLMAPKLARRHKTFTIWLLRIIIAVYALTYFKLAQF
ncbi:DUF5658 family protein [Armatimonas sp.]|uniref:DUF5658 family protein n=1 Tax=Armatimonas sp. TaxID=1872638 RepID=UPI0037519835